MSKHTSCLAILMFSLLFYLMQNDPDPDLHRDVPQLLLSRGFEYEEHYVTTDDGVILKHFRIINPRFKASKVKRRPIVVFHSFLGSSGFFMVGHPDGHVNDTSIPSNMGFALPKVEEFDVWMCHVRGTNGTIDHVSLPPDDPQLWEFSYDEHIKYDLPATLDYIMRVTKASSVGYVGHSQGALIMFGLLTQRPEYSSVIKPFLAMAPVTHMIRTTASAVNLPQLPFFFKLLKWRSPGNLPFVPLFNFLAGNACRNSLSFFVCKYSYMMYTGYPDETDQMNQTRLSVYGTHMGQTSIKSFFHYFQSMKSKKFQKYDYGSPEDNIMMYGTPEPPQYDMTKINHSSIILFTSLNDVYAVPYDIEILREKLSKNSKIVEDYVVPLKEWTHTDFIWGRDSATLINSKIIDLLLKYTNSTHVDYIQ